MISRYDALEAIPLEHFGKMVLDVGCYTGVYSASITQFNRPAPTITGIDRDLSALRIAKHNLTHVVLCDASYLPFRQKVFSCVIACEVIEHLSRLCGFWLFMCLREISDRLILTTPITPSEGASQLFDDHPLMRHQSEWTIEDMKQFGATWIRGLGVKYRPPFALFRFVLAILGYYFPKYFAAWIMVRFDW